MPKHKVHLQKEIWIVLTFADPQWIMGKCFHGFHDPTPKVEWDGYHVGGDWSIFEIGQNDAN